MKILAIEASGPVAGCALYEDGTLIAEYSAQYKKKHSQSLVPMLQEMKNMVDLDLPSVDFIAVTSGPGSFTGLRIGAATAKGLGLALEKPILPVPTVDSLACNIFGSDLYADGIGDTIEGMVREMLAGKGAVRNTLRKYLG